MCADRPHQTLYFAGRDYLATTRRALGYQGYGGPAGWQACVLSPLEFAFRAGLNIVMYVLTGSYKADQVHVPALLERLGQ